MAKTTATKTPARKTKGKTAAAPATKSRKKLTPKKLGTGRYSHAGYLISQDKETGVWPVSLLSDPETIVLNDAETAHAAFDQLLDALEAGTLEALEETKAAPKRKAKVTKTKISDNVDLVEVSDEPATAETPAAKKAPAKKTTKAPAKLGDVNLPEATKEQEAEGKAKGKKANTPRRSKVTVEMIQDIRHGYDNLTSGKMEYYRMKAEEHGLGLETVAKISRRDIHANVE